LVGSNISTPPRGIILGEPENEGLLLLLNSTSVTAKSRLLFQRFFTKTTPPTTPAATSATIRVPPITLPTTIPAIAPALKPLPPAPPVSAFVGGGTTGC